MTHVAILNKVESAIEEYKAALAAYEVARLEFTLARERYVRTKELAFAMMTLQEKWEWSQAHPELQFMRGSVGEAIDSVIFNACIRQCMAFVAGKAESYVPRFSVDQLVDALRRGGFEFKSATPGREVNAALMRLKDIEKNGLDYIPSDEVAEDVLKAVKDGAFG